MKKYCIANVHSALQEYTPDLPEDSEWGITDWTLYIILPVGGGFVTLIIAFLVFSKCRPCAIGPNKTTKINLTMQNMKLLN